MPIVRLHNSSIVVGLIMALLLVLIEVPGRVVSGGGGPNGSRVYEHGWPWVFLRRETADRTKSTIVTSSDGKLFALQPSLVFNPINPRYDLPHWGIPWLSAENWRFWQADVSAVPPHWDFHRVLLACDLAIALSVLAGVVAVWKFWRRRQAKLFTFRFGLRALLLAVGAMGVALGWLSYLEREHRREAALIEHVFETSGPMEGTWFDTDQVCLAPSWLVSLVGVRLFPSYFWRASAVEIQPEYGHNTEFFCGQISQLKYVRKIAVDGHPRIRFRFSALRDLKYFDTLVIWTYPIISEQDINELAQLKQLRKIVIEDIDEIAPAALSRLKFELPKCRIIDDLDDW